MKVNITAGECLNEILSNIYKDEYFVPFNEAMINGTYNSKIFTNEFIKERSITHNVSIEEYTSKLSLFLNFIDNINKYNEVVLWFGDEPFCNANKEVVLKTLQEYDYKGSIVSNIVDEENGEIIRSIKLK